MSAAIEVHNLTKYYARVCALDKVTLEVRQGECFGLLGPNGAGKTTLMKILLNLISPSSGTVSILGQPAHKEQMREKIGYLPEKVKVYDFLTGSEFLDYQGKLYGMDRPQREVQVEKCLKLVGMYAERLRMVREYSKGMIQRLGLAQALLNRPSLLLLDEPTVGLDPISNKEIRNVLLRLKAEEVTIFISSHLLSEVELVCDRVAILHRGRVVRIGSKHELTAKEAKVELRVKGINEALIQKLAEIASQCVQEEERILLTLKDAQDIGVVPAIVISHGGTLLSLMPQESLEDIFYRIIKEEEGRHWVK